MSAQKLHSHNNAWTSLPLLGHPNTFLAQFKAVQGTTIFTLSHLFYCPSGPAPGLLMKGGPGEPPGPLGLAMS